MRFVVTLTFIAIALLSLLAFQGSHVDKEYIEKVEGLYSNVMRNFSKIRGYDVEVPLKVVTVQWVLERWGAEKVDSEYLRNEELFLKSLLLVPKNFSYPERKSEEVRSFRAFSWEGAIYVVYENFNPDESAAETMAHELEHIVQEKYFELKSDGSYDGEKAYAATIEGDAVLMGWLYTKKNISIEHYEMSEINERNCLDFLYHFPYIYGARFVCEAYINGGYAEVDKILKNLPQTTEQIIHPEKYYSNEGFEYIGEDAFAQNMELIKKDRLGEILVFVFLAAHIDDDVASKAAEGWNGDSYILYKNTNGFIWRWTIAWDSKEDAYEFYNAVKEMLSDVGWGDDGWVNAPYIEQRVEVELNGKAVIIKGEYF